MSCAYTSANECLIFQNIPSTLVFAAVSLNLNTSYGFNFPGSLQYFSSFPDQASISFPEKAFPAGTGELTQSSELDFRGNRFFFLP